MNDLIVSQNRNRKLRTRMMIFMIAAALIVSLIPYGSLSVYAGKEGVFLNDNVYFTLEQVDASVGNEGGLLRYTVRLNNNGDDTVDMNAYGVKVKTPDGASLPGRLAGKASSLVKPGQSIDYEWISELPAQIDAELLKVTVFAWDFSESDFMRDLGDLTVSAAEHMKRSDRPQTVVNLREADSVLTENAFVALEPVRSHLFMKNGSWHLDVDLLAENLGSSGFKIPDGVQFRLHDESGHVYPGSLIYGLGQSLLPKQKKIITVEVPMGSMNSADSTVLQILSKEADVLASLQLDKATVVSIGKSLSWTVQGKYPLEITAERHETGKEAEGIRVQSIVTVRNPNGEAVALPVLTAQYQLPGLEVAALDGFAHPAFLSANNEETYQFSAVLPEAADLQSAQLAVLEQRSSNPDVQAPVLVSELKTIFGNIDFSRTPEYALGQPMKLKSASSLYASDLQVSLQELNVHENEDMGYQSLIAKFVLKNASDESLTLPAIRTELLNFEGVAYTGNRQSTTTNQLIPNLGYVLCYSYLVPNTQITEPFVLRLKDEKTSALLAEYRVAPQEKSLSDDTITVFPFKLNLRDWTIAATYGGGSYSYKFKMNLDIQREENVAVDQNFPKLEFDLVDSLGRVLGSETASFIGIQKLVSGMQTIEFKNLKTDQFESPLTLNIYETFETQAGTAKRLVKSLHRSGM